MVIDVLGEDVDDFNLKEYADRQQKIARALNEGELERRIRKALDDVWYLPVLSKYYKVIDYGSIKTLSFHEQMKNVEMIIRSKF